MFERRGRDGDALESGSLSGRNLSLRVEGWGFTVQPGVQALGYMSMQACLNFLAHFIVLTDDKGLPRGLLFIFKYSSNGVLFFAALDEKISACGKRWGVFAFGETLSEDMWTRGLGKVVF